MTLLGHVTVFKFAFTHVVPSRCGASANKNCGGECVLVQIPHEELDVAEVATSRRS